MPFWNKFPYTDFHELNLDWIISTIKSFGDRIDNFSKDLKKYVDEWLTEHPEATTTVQDDSLTTAKYKDGSVTEPKLSTDLQNKVNHKYIFARASFLYENPNNCVNVKHGFGLSFVTWDTKDCIIYDLGDSIDGNTTPNFLRLNGITKVSAVIISHYHSDHVSATSLNALLNSGIDFSNCIFYLPHYGIDRSKAINTSLELANELIIKNILNEHDITYVEPDREGYNIEIGNYTIDFYNVTSGLFDDYYNYKYYSKGTYETESTRYNNFSMCCNINIGGKNIFLTGDIELPAEENMAKYAAKCDLYQISHHGRNLRESISLINSLHCSLGVNPVFYDTGGESTEGILAPTSMRCRELGTLLSTLNRTVNIIIGNGGIYSDSTNDMQNGVGLGQILVRGTDFDTLNYGDYYCSQVADIPTFINAPPIPSNINRTFTLKVEPLNQNSSSDNRIVQTVIVRASSGNGAWMYQRNKIDTWSDWALTTIPLTKSRFEDTSYITTGDLYFNPAVIKGSVNTGAFKDYNTMLYSGFYVSDVASQCINGPTNDYQCYLIVLSCRNTSGTLRVRQIAIQTSATSTAPNIYHRTFWASDNTDDTVGTWSEWVH